MKMTCHREGLLSACQLASAALPAREVKPILKNFKAVAENDRCTLMATDLELGIRLEVRGLQVQEAGEAILPASRLVAILREAQDEQLALEADNSACTIRGQHMEFEMPGEDPINFPDFPDFADDGYHEISAGTLRQMIRRTLFAAATESARYATTGVLWELEADHFRLVATDGRRLAMTQGPATVHGSGKATPSVVPSKAMSLLERNLQNDEAPVRVCMRPNEVLFRTEGNQAVIYSRLVEGRFPNYRDVFPKKQTTRVPLEIPPFLAAVRQAAIMTDEETQRVVFHFGKKKLTLEAKGSTTGRSKVEMDVAYEGKALDISFNPKFLVDMLRALEPDTPLHLDLVDGSSPAMFKAGEEYSYLIMPLT